MMRTLRPYSILWTGLITSVLVSSCLGGDPWPEPDPVQAGGDDDSKDSDASNGQADSDAQLPCSNGDPSIYVYASVPSAYSGEATVVGLPGASGRATGQVSIANSLGEEVNVDVSEDGSFAGRILAEQGELLAVRGLLGGTKNCEEHTVSIRAGRAGASVENGIIGDGKTYGPDGEGQVLVHGDGAELRGGDVVIGANLDGSSASSTLVASGHFDLFLSGKSGDAIDLFLVTAGERVGRTDQQTTSVP